MLKENKIASMLLVRQQSILYTFEIEESFSNVIVYLFAFYFLFDIPYPEKYEIILGYFHELLEIPQPVVFTKAKSKTYSRILTEMKSSLKK